jgi:hypothetical protein
LRFFTSWVSGFRVMRTPSVACVTGENFTAVREDFARQLLTCAEDQKIPVSGCAFTIWIYSGPGGLFE